MEQTNPYMQADAQRTRSRDYMRSCMFLNQVGGCVEECEFPTYLPSSYSDRPALHTVWKRRDELERLRRSEAGENPNSAPSLKELMAEKRMMEREMKEAQEVRGQYRTRHITVMGKTDSLCKNSVVENLLAEAKALTSDRGR